MAGTLASTSTPHAFDPWKIQAVTHRLVRSPAAADRRARRARQAPGGAQAWCAPTATTPPPGTSFADAPNLHPNQRRRRGDARRHRRGASAWMSLLNVQADPVYRRWSTRSSTRSARSSSRRDPGMCYRAGWIFVSSPGAVTPFHIDHEHNFILQIRGTQAALHLGPVRSRGRLASARRSCSTTSTRASWSSGTTSFRAARARLRARARPRRLHAVDHAAHGRERRRAVDHDQLHLLHRLDAPPRAALPRQRADCAGSA